MSGLLFLTNGDFAITKGTKGNILCHGIRGFSLILFYSTQCTYCQTLLPKFKRLPGTIGGCQFGIINVSTNKNVIGMARNTIAPIEYVPYIILYINGRPWMRYDGPHDEDEIRKFVLEVANKVQNKQQFTEGRVKDEGVGIPKYTIGQPIQGDKKDLWGRSYLDFDHAYKPGQIQGRMRK